MAGITITKGGQDWTILLSPGTTRQGKHTRPAEAGDLVAGLGAARDQGIGITRVLTTEEEYDSLQVAVTVLQGEIAHIKHLTVAATVMLAKVRAGKRIHRGEGDALLGRLARELGIALVVLD